MIRSLTSFLFVGALIFSQVAAQAADKTAETTTPVPRDGGWMATHEKINQRAAKGDVDLLFVGDSITQGWKNNSAWKEHFAPRNAMNAGIGGDRTQHVLWRLDNGNVEGIKPKLAVVMIGTNNLSRNPEADIAAGIKAIVAKLREKLPETKVLLLGIFPRGAKADDPFRAKIRTINDEIKQLDDGQSVLYLDIGEQFLESDGSLSKEIMYDHLHLTDKGYEIWAEAIEPKVTDIVSPLPAEAAK